VGERRWNAASVAMMADESQNFNRRCQEQRARRLELVYLIDPISHVRDHVLCAKYWHGFWHGYLLASALAWGISILDSRALGDGDTRPHQMRDNGLKLTCTVQLVLPLACAHAQPIQILTALRRRPRPHPRYFELLMCLSGFLRNS
jgi:hypothetical protein